MPAPSSAILRPDLQATYQEFDMELQKQSMIGNLVFPVFNAPEKAGHFGKVPAKSLLNMPDAKRAPKGRYNRSDYKFDQTSWICEEYGWEEVVDDSLLEQYRYIFDAEKVAADRSLGVMLRAYEARVAAAVFNTTLYTGASLLTTVGTAWSTVATATPVADVSAAKKKVRNNTGMLPNAVIMDWEVFENLRNTTSVIDRLKYAGYDDPKNLGMEVFAQLFGVKHFLVAGASAVADSANDGQAISLSQLWSTGYVMVCKIAETNDLQEPCIGRTFNWTADSGTGEDTFVVEEYREEQSRGSVLRCRHHVDELNLTTACGHLLDITP